MRALIERKDAPMNLRLEAISSFSSDRATTDDAAYLRALYAQGRQRSDEERRSSNTIGRIGGTENDTFVLDHREEHERVEPSPVRRVVAPVASPTVTIADLGKIYDAADSYDVRARIVQILGSRKEPESADKLIDIVKNSTDTRVRTRSAAGDQPSQRPACPADS